MYPVNNESDHQKKKGGDFECFYEFTKTIGRRRDNQINFTKMLIWTVNLL